MDIKTYCKKFMIWTAIIVAVIMLICGLCFGRIIEANIWEEIGKWVVMTLFIIAGCEALAYTMSQFFYHGSRWDPDSKKYKELHEDVELKYEIYENNIRIYEAYKARKWIFRDKLAAIKEEHPECAVWNRSVGSLRHEWATHNLLYNLGIFRSKTGTCDLNYPLKWYVGLGYWIIGTVALLFIK